MRQEGSRTPVSAAYHNKITRTISTENHREREREIERKRERERERCMVGRPFSGAVTMQEGEYEARWAGPFREGSPCKRRERERACGLGGFAVRNQNIRPQCCRICTHLHRMSALQSNTRNHMGSSISRGWHVGVRLPLCCSSVYLPWLLRLPIGSCMSL